MNKTIFFTFRYITFASAPLENYDLTIDSRADSIASISRAKVVDFFEKYNSILFLCHAPLDAYDQFCQDFKMVEAAGGVVENHRGEQLMIHRNGRWDLPKGHLEIGETLEQCAVREVEEETGIKVDQIGDKITETLHAYPLRNNWEIKTTHWYSMKSHSEQPQGQSEEGIDQVEWCPKHTVVEHLIGSYPTIQNVFEALRP